MSLASARQQQRLRNYHSIMIVCVRACACALNGCVLHFMHFEIIWSVVVVGMICKMSKKMQDGRSKFQVILLEDNRSIVLCKDEAQKCHTAILERHRIPTYVQL